MSLSFFFTRKLNASGSNSFTRIIIKLAIVAVALSLAVMLTTVCIVTGFRGEIRDKVTGFASHIQITRTDNNDSYEGVPVASTRQYIDSLSLLPNIQYAQVYAYKPGIIKTKDQIEGIVLKGIDRYYHQDFFKDHLLAGKVIQFNDSLKKHICISKTTADRLNLKTGDKMNIYFLGAHLSARAFIVSGIYETGLDEFDRSFAITDIATIRKLNGWSANDCHGIELMVKDMNLLPQTTNTIHRKLPLEMAARSMKELYPQIFEWLSLVDTNVYIIIIIMMLIALITMITTVIVLIIERTQMIGTLKSVGANNKLITQIFLRMAARLIAVGLFWGNLIALSFCWIQKEYHLIKLDQQSYYMKYVPIHFDMAWILGINAGTFVVCIFFLLLPSLIIARISPMTAIRFN